MSLPMVLETLAALLRRGLRRQQSNPRRCSRSHHIGEACYRPFLCIFAVKILERANCKGFDTRRSIDIFRCCILRERVMY